MTELKMSRQRVNPPSCDISLSYAGVGWSATRPNPMRLKQVGINVGVKRIHQVDGKRLRRSIQDRLEGAVFKVSLPRVWFDVVWGVSREDA